jgi:hypothetical protein
VRQDIFSLETEGSETMRTMKALELKPEDLPMTVRLKTHEGSKDYVLVLTKQEKLLLNKPLESVRER